MKHSSQDAPIFITGVYRSGTTIVSRMLDAHPLLDVAYDSVNYYRWYIKKNTKPNEFRKIVSDTAERLLNRYDKKIDVDRIIDNIKKIETPKHENIYSAIMEDYFSYSGKRWGEKTLMEWTNIPLFLSMFPKGKIIHIIRDPRDVMASYKKMTIEKGDRYLDSVFACMHSMNAAHNYKKVLSTSRYYALSYESLLESPKNELVRLCDFLEIDYSEDMLDENKYIDLKGFKFTKGTHTSFPDDDNRSPTGRWKEHLKDYEVALIEGLLATQMSQFGYVRSSSNTSKVLNKLMGVIMNEPVLVDRFQNYLLTGDGVEAYPSDPTDPLNWGSDSGNLGLGAAAAYGMPTK